MFSKLKSAALALAVTCLLAGAAFAQTSAIEGNVKGDDGKPIKDAIVKIERKDIKGNYKTKSDKKGHYLHVGLPLGVYKVTVEVDGKERDMMDNVRTRLGDPTVVDFDLQAIAQRQAAMQKAAESGTLTQEQARDMSPEQKAALEKQMKERAAQLAKNKELNESFNVGMEALKNKQYDAAVTAFEKASTMDPKQHVVWAQLAESYSGQSQTKTGAEQEAVLTKAIDAFNKAIELKPDDAAYHNNFGLALVRAKKIPEAQNELNKAAQLDPANAGRYFYNLGAILTNIGQLDAAGDAFKKAIEADPNYADAHFQYGVYLISKATTTPDGKIVPPAGTREAFEKYLALRPDGPFAQGAKDMIASMETKVETEYKNPSVIKKAPPKKK
jgi:tetratricopeptide (TPR) repeat protein